MAYPAVIGLCIVASTVAFGSPSVQRPARFTTAASVEAFGSCFVASQESSGRDWWYVPSETGGTFSNAHFTPGERAYFFTIYDSGRLRQIRFSGNGDANSAEVAVTAAIRSCT